MQRPSPDAGKIVAIVLGATEFPGYGTQLNNLAFGRSSAAFLGYLQDVLGLRAEQILNLFDDPASVIDLDERISSFLARNTDSRNVIIFYVGHGGFLSDREYYLAVRSTRKSREHTTGMRIRAIAETLGQFAGDKNLMLILDCCFAGEAVKEFQSNDLATVVENKTFDALPETGTALLVAASKDEPAISPASKPYTMFSESFIKVLTEGVRSKQERLSLRDVAVRTQALIKSQYGLIAVRPEVHAPRQRGINVADLEIFPNRQALTALGGAIAKPPTTTSRQSATYQLKHVRNAYTVAPQVVTREFVALVGDIFFNQRDWLDVLDQANRQLLEMDPSAVLIRRGNLILGSTSEEFWQSLFDEAGLQGHRTMATLLCALLDREMQSSARESCETTLKEVIDDYHSQN
ncbi:caspase family protein [Bradyrhizobium sp. 956_D2_N1_5]|uniref:caspase family protein n=1 Tax=unclassified Bradyrhizobium TaxID=2631580 RepID=UPI003F206FBB